MAAAPIARILVIEDGTDDFTLMRRAFARCDGADEIFWCRDGVEAVAALSLNQPRICPDLILSDLKMPRMDGFEFVQWVRQQNQWKSVPVVILSCSDFAGDRDRALALGADIYLVKPSDFAGLIEIARTLKGLATSSAANKRSPL